MSQTVEAGGTNLEAQLVGLFSSHEQLMKRPSCRYRSQQYERDIQRGNTAHSKQTFPKQSSMKTNKNSKHTQTLNNFLIFTTNSLQ